MHKCVVIIINTYLTLKRRKTKGLVWLTHMQH